MTLATFFRDLGGEVSLCGEPGQKAHAGRTAMSLAANVAAVNAGGAPHSPKTPGCATAACLPMSLGEPGDENDKNIQQWKIKKLIKSLELARGYTLRHLLLAPPRFSS